MTNYSPKRDPGEPIPPSLTDNLAVTITDGFLDAEKAMITLRRTLLDSSGLQDEKGRTQMEAED